MSTFESQQIFYIFNWQCSSPRRRKCTVVLVFCELL